MMRVRPIEPRDFDDLVRFAHESGHGFTSLPKNEDQLRRRIEHAAEAVRVPDDHGGAAGYLFVMEDVESGTLVGTTGIEARVGLDDAFYHYHLSKVVHSSRELGIYNTVDVLTLCNDYTGASELCTLFLTPAARARQNGHLLSRCRFLFMAEHPQRFAEQVIAELRGVSDDNGRSPFWTWLQKHFFSMDLADAVHRVGLGQKSFIAELMPSYPVYVSLLDDAAQAVIGEVHEQTRPARRLLQKEGFNFRGYVDPFDAGPSVEAYRDDIRSIRNSARFAVNASERVPADAPVILLANTRVKTFRATYAPAQINPDTDTISVDPAVLNALEVEAGEMVRAVGV